MATRSISDTFPAAKSLCCFSVSIKFIVDGVEKLRETWQQVGLFYHFNLLFCYGWIGHVTANAPG